MMCFSNLSGYSKLPLQSANMRKDFFTLQLTGLDTTGFPENRLFWLVFETQVWLVLLNAAEFLKSKYLEEMLGHLLDFAMRDKAGFTRKISTFV